MPVLTCACGQKVRVPENRPGARFRCPKCGQSVTSPAEVPQAAQVAQAAPDVALAEPDVPSDDSAYEERPRGRRAPNSTLAITSLILGLAALICLPLGAIGLVLGVIALISIANSKDRLRGSGLAVGGIVASLAITVLGSLLTYFLWKHVLKPGFDKVGEAADRLAQASGRLESMNDLKELGLAMHKYQDEHRTFPTAAIYGKDGRPLLSWRVAILPHLDDERAAQLYRRFKLDEAWDSPHNRALMSEMPDVFSGDDVPPHHTRYQALVGPGTMFDGQRGVGFASILDGSSNTILLVEAATAVPWTKPEDLTYAPNRPLPPFHSRGGSGFGVLTADGAVHTYRDNFDEAEMRKAITRNDGIPIVFEKLERR